MADLTATFEAGVNGNAVSEGDAGSASAWDIVDPTDPTYSNTHVAHGTLACKVTTGDLGWTTSFPDPSDHYGRVYVYFTANPATAFSLVYCDGGVTNRLYINASGQIELCRAAIVQSTSTSVVNLNGWTRIEYHLINNGSTGTFECKIFLTMDSTSADQTVTTAAYDSGAGTTAVYFGNCTTTGGNADFWIDDCVANATSYPGPASTPPPPAPSTATLIVNQGARW